MTAASTALPPSPASIAGSATLAGLDDFQLAAWLRLQRSGKKEVVLVCSGTTCKVYEKADLRCVLQAVDPESDSHAVLKALAKQGRLFCVEISPSEMADATAVDAAWTPQAMSEGDVKAFLEQRKIRLGRVEGRGEPIRLETANQVWADAGGCCMFTGCGSDLSIVPLYNKGARIAYLAHIVASDPEGPRGTIEESHLLADNAENIMLMCDAHHRLIDSFAPEAFKTPRLREMRREHTEKVRGYRKAMRYPEAQAMTLFADLGNIPTHFPDSVLMEALLVEGFSMRAEVKRHLTYQARDDRTGQDFWGNYLRQMELPIRTMVQDLGQSVASSAGPLAVFPVHHTPTLTLAGRIVGEARNVRVFQRSRKRSSWQWDPAALAHPPGTFTVSGLTDSRADEVLLTVELTAKIDEQAVPGSLLKAVESHAIPWVRITTDSPSSECLQRAEDLAQVMDVARLTINTIQDKMRASRVHLIVVSPASVAFSIGQLLQAGHHAPFTLYDRPNHERQFQEAFTINGYSVIPPAGSAQSPISIR
ncbi:SAVED domain-containing protein [Pandoraea sputorum]|uniref:SAVED domain-containing protein n=1 Tax=Pandoraea sputorum TaxID=93222 RepID=UPI001E3A6E20|nr:SAVED domain-containing protein [Pandoraea sputorum]MCE4058734.1 SAVED domain-containing protein [Pandoraea sputorum]